MWAGLPVSSPAPPSTTCAASTPSQPTDRVMWQVSRSLRSRGRIRRPSCPGRTGGGVDTFCAVASIVLGRAFRWRSAVVEVACGVRGRAGGGRWLPWRGGGPWGAGALHGGGDGADRGGRAGRPQQHPAGEVPDLGGGGEHVSDFLRLGGAEDRE